MNIQNEKNFSKGTRWYRKASEPFFVRGFCQRARCGIAYCALPFLAIGCLAGIVKGDVLYDSTVAITEEGTWYFSFPPTYIGGEAQFGDFPRDQQAADDFDLAATYRITSVTGDYLSIGSPPPANGVLVEFFSDSSGVPSETPFAAALSSAVTFIPVLPDIFGDDAIRLTVDLGKDGITLGPGTWWVSITPVDLTPKVGLAAFQFNSIDGVFGSNAYFRDGGIDHGNGYPGLYGTFDWTLHSEIGGGSPDRDLAMRIEGSRLPDLDGDGSVGVKDLLILLGEWG